MIYIKKNMFALLVSQAATWIISLIVLAVVPDYLGDDGFGKLTFATAYVAFFILAAELGTPTYMTKEVARDHSIVGSYVFNTFMLKVVWSLALSVVAIALARLLGNTGDVLALIAIGCFGMLLTVLNDVLAAALAGMERMAKPAAFFTIQIYVGSIGGLIVLFMGGGLILYSIVYALAGLIPVIANSLLLWPRVRGNLRVDFGVWRIVAVGGLPLMVLVVFNRIYGTIDVPILNQIAGEETVGWYGVAYRWASIPIFISTAVMTAFFPQFSAHGAAETTEFRRLVNRAIRLVMFVAIPSAVGIAMVAGDLIGLFYNGDTYDPSIVLIQILAIHIPIAAVDTILAMALIAADRQHRYMYVAGIAAVLNPIACIFAIHATMNAFDNGAIGAAIVTVGTEMFILGGALLLRPQGVMDRPTVIAAVRFTAAGVVMIPALLVAGSLPLAVKVVVGVVAYLAASVAFGAISVTDLKRAVREVFEAIGSLRSRTTTPAPAGQLGNESGNVEGTHLGGDLYAESGGQDRDRDRERVGE
jgi:O-antigen/teichoic acid export membrane protein